MHVRPGEAVIANFGISAALLTPFHADGQMNVPLLCTHAVELLENGSSGITLFGTTGEGASVGLDERYVAISEVTAAGIDKDEITLGLCGNAISDVVAQIKQGTQLGIARFLLLPPFYFKGVSDEGLFEWHAELFARVPPAARFIVYHIPQVTQIPLSYGLIARLCAAFPERVIAVKDSAGQWEDTRILLGDGTIPVLVGDERLLHKAAALGGAGSICGMANLFPARLNTLLETKTEDVELSSDVDLIVSVPVIPALKQALAVLSGNSDWLHLRAPLQPLDVQSAHVIAERFSGRMQGS